MPKIFLFTRNLRWDDNPMLTPGAPINWRSEQTGESRATTPGASGLPMFVFNPEQLPRGSDNKEFAGSRACINFMLDSLEELNNTHPVLFMYGDPGDCVNEIIKICKDSGIVIDEIVMMRDYTPFAKSRAANIERVTGVKLTQVHDNLFNDYIYKLNETPGDTNKTYHAYDPGVQRHIYQKFSSYYNAYVKRITPPGVAFPDMKVELINFASLNLHEKKVNAPGVVITDLITMQTKYRDPGVMPNYIGSGVYQPGGRSNALKLIEKYLDYIKDADPGETLLTPTSRLSPHLKFGTISPREVCAKITSPEFRRSVMWRDFYHSLLQFDPDALTGKTYNIWKDNPGELPKQLESSDLKLTWPEILATLTPGDRERFEQWCNGTTPDKFVNAGMHQLNRVHFMHNRMRMICAEYLIHDLGIHWRYGELYFRKQLTDYDPGINNYNWQWVLGYGPSARAPFQRFNRENQQKKYDPRGTYVDTWNS